MARFLADENFLGDAVAALREAGHEVAWIRTDAPGSTDREVLARAVAEQRILLTFDKDFGEIAYHYRLPATCGIVLFRISLPSPHAAVRLIKAVLQSRDDWAGHFFCCGGTSPANAPVTAGVIPFPNRYYNFV